MTALHELIAGTAMSSKSEKMSRFSDQATGASPNNKLKQQSAASSHLEDGWEVFVCYRSLREMSGDFYNSLPPKLKAGLRDIGLCHYMTIFRSPQGELIQFDFGPRGGDVAITLPSARHANNFASISCSAEHIVEMLHHENGTIYASPGGEIREERLEEGLPPTALFMGRTRCSLAQIRDFNNSQNMSYVLNRNDCRHYVDMLVKFSTGVDRASASLMRHTVSQKCSQPPRLRDHLAQVAQLALEKESTALLARAIHSSFAMAMTAVSLRLGATVLLSGRDVFGRGLALSGRGLLPALQSKVSNGLLALAGAVLSHMADGRPVLRQASGLQASIKRLLHQAGQQTACNGEPRNVGPVAEGAGLRTRRSGGPALRPLMRRQQLVQMASARGDLQQLLPQLSFFRLRNKLVAASSKHLESMMRTGLQLHATISCVGLSTSHRSRPVEAFPLILSKRL